MPLQKENKILLRASGATENIPLAVAALLPITSPLPLAGRPLPRSNRACSRAFSAANAFSFSCSLFAISSSLFWSLLTFLGLNRLGPPAGFAPRAPPLPPRVEGPPGWLEEVIDGVTAGSDRGIGARAGVGAGVSVGIDTGEEFGEGAVLSSRRC